MNKTYNTPEIKVIRFEQTDDVIQTSGDVPTVPTIQVAGIDATEYEAQNFSIFGNNQ